MQFLAPLFLAGLAAAAIPVWIHLVRQHRAPVVAFPAVRFIKAAPVEQRSMRRLRDWLLLALRVAAVALLAIAFARPFIADAAGTPPATIVAVDVSASMGGPRFDAARAAARAAVDDAPAGHRVGVAAFDHHGRAVLLPQSDRGAARAAIDRLQPGFGATRYAAGLAGAVDALGGAPGRIIVVTDRQRAGWAGDAAARVPAGVDVVWSAVDPPARNVGVIDVGVRAGRARATLVNSGRERAAAVATLAARAPGGAAGGAETPLGTRAVDIAPGETQVVEFPEPLPSSGDLSVTVADEGGVPGDDARYLVLDPAPARRVLMVTSGLDDDREAYYATRALDAAAAARVSNITVAGGVALRDRIADALDDADVAMVLSTRGLERAAPEAIRAFRARGGGVLLVAGPTSDPGVLAELFDGGETRALPGAAAADALVVSDARHPVFASLGPLAGALGSARVTRSMLFEAERAAVLARYTSGAAAIVERQRVAAEGRTLLLTTDIANAWNDLALHPAFVPLLHEITSHLDGRARRARAYTVGAADAPSERPGVVSATAPAVWRAAVNVDAAESDSARFLDGEARVVTDTAVAARAAEAAREREAEHPLWRYAIVLMMAALLAEGAMGRSGGRHAGA